MNPNLTNEKIFGLELGYGFRASWLNANINAYRTDWKDRFLRRTQQISNPVPGGATISAYANIEGIKEIHQGIEFEASSKINKYITVTGMFGIADWYYKGNANGSLFNETNEPIDDLGNVVAGGVAGVRTLYLDNIKVGNAAQTTASLGLQLTPVEDLRFDANYRYVDRLYANLNVLNFANEATAAKGALELPSFGLVDLGLSYKFKLNDPKQFFTIRGNVFNLFDTTYIAQSYTNIHASDKTGNATSPTYEEAGQLYDGIATKNEVFFGFGRTWSAAISFNF